MSILTQDFVLFAIASEKAGTEFPIDFDDVWQSTGYSRKDHAVRFLKKRLRLNQDYRSPDRGRSLDGEKYFLTVDGFKFFLAKSNTTEGDETLWYFIQIEKTYRAQLEAQFQAPAHTAPTFDYPATQLQAIAGYATLSYTKSTIRRDFVVGIHYIERAREIMLTEVCFAMAVTSSRSRSGIDLDNCPSIKIDIKDAIAHHNAKAANKQNARLCRQVECPGQLSLDLGLD